MTSFSSRSLSGGEAIKIESFFERLPQWHVFARAGFELIPDYFNRAFLGGDNVRSGACSLDGEGYVDFHRPLHSPILRAYTGASFNPVLLLEVRRYGVKFKVSEWRFAGHRIEVFTFQCRAPA